MTVRLSGDRIHILGPGLIEDAESLVALLQANRARSVDLAAAGVLHTALVQVLLAFRPRLTGLPDDPFFKMWLMPGLTAAADDPGIVTDGVGVAEATATQGDEPAPARPSEST
jgi:hypothetical protein